MQNCNLQCSFNVLVTWFNFRRPTFKKKNWVIKSALNIMDKIVFPFHSLRFTSKVLLCSCWLTCFTVRQNKIKGRRDRMRLTDIWMLDCSLYSEQEATWSARDIWQDIYMALEGSRIAIGQQWCNFEGREFLCGLTGDICFLKSWQYYETNIEVRVS